MSGKHMQFRWRYYDDALGDQWSRWHSVDPPCPSCCCGGPDEGEHQEGAEYYVENGILESGHSRYDPIAPDFEHEVEWRAAGDELAAKAVEVSQAICGSEEMASEILDDAVHAYRVVRDPEYANARVGAPAPDRAGDEPTEVGSDAERANETTPGVGASDRAGDDEPRRFVCDQDPHPAEIPCPRCEPDGRAGGGHTAGQDEPDDAPAWDRDLAAHEKDLTLGLAYAAAVAREEVGGPDPRLTSTTAAVMADWLIRHGWPAAPAVDTAAPDGQPRYAIIRVQPTPSLTAWPIVERAPGGWQSGVHHYPDADVEHVQPLTLTADLSRDSDEWCVFYGGPDPDACAGLEVTSQEEAEEASQWLIESGVAVRRVYRSPWQVRGQCSSCRAALDGRDDCCDARQTAAGSVSPDQDGDTRRG